MTPLEYIQSNPSLEDARTKMLVFSDTLKTDLGAKQATVDSNHRISPVQLTDGRWVVSCDLVTAITDIYAPIFSVLDAGKLNEATIELKADIEPLFPQPYNML